MEALKIADFVGAAIDNSPMVLSEIFSENNSLVVWQRAKDKTISHYFSSIYNESGMGLRGVYSIESLRAELQEELPDREGKYAAIEDIYLLSDMLTCLFNCDSVGLRLVPLASAMCPKFHTDNIQVRLVNTYLGPGTEWIPPGSALSEFNKKPVNLASNTPEVNKTDVRVKQLSAFDVALLKGSAWENQEHMACLHRSCQVPANTRRVLLTLDPM